MTQTTKAPQKSSTATETQETQEAVATVEKNADLAAAVDDMLDEIDSVLEENAEEFVRAYIQKGGQ